MSEFWVNFWSTIFGVLFSAPVRWLFFGVVVCWLLSNVFVSSVNDAVRRSDERQRERQMQEVQCKWE